MQCPNCGQTYQQGDQYCGSCGNKLNGSLSQSTQSTTESFNRRFNLQVILQLLSKNKLMENRIIVSTIVVNLHIDICLMNTVMLKVHSRLR